MKRNCCFKNDFEGLFLNFEGIDFSGKSDQVVRTFNWIKANVLNLSHDSVVMTKEPTKEHFGLEIRKILGDPRLFEDFDGFKLQELYARDGRVNTQRIIVPQLRKGNIVCADRWRTSFCYGAERGNEIELDMLLEMNCRYMGEYFICPDATFLIDVSPEVAIERGRTSGRQMDEMEKFKTLEKVAANYLLMKERYPQFNWHLINGSRTREDIFVDIRTVLEKLLKEKDFKVYS